MTKFVINDDFKNTSQAIIAQIRAKVDANAPISFDVIRTEVTQFGVGTTDSEIEQAAIDSGFKILDIDE